MHRSVLLTALLATAPAVIGAPVARREAPTKGISLPLRRTPVPRLARRDSGGGPLTSDQGSQWIAKACFGEQELNFLIDTGSSYLWALSDLLPQSEINTLVSQGHSIYNTSASSTWTYLPGSSFTAAYESSSATGPLGNETVSFGGFEVVMPVMAASSTNGEPDDSSYDGIMGLDWSAADADDTNSNYSQPAFFQAIQDQLDQPIFTLEVHAAENSTGTLNFGFIDESKYTGSLSTVAVESSDTDWLVDGVSFSVNGQNVSTKTTKALFDSGGFGFSSDDEQVAINYWSNVQGATQQSDGTWIFPCTSDTPDFTFDFSNGASSTIPGSVMNPTSATIQGNETYCSGGVQAASGSGTNSGDPFFIQNFMVFNFQEPSLSFAPMT